MTCNVHFFHLPYQDSLSNRISTYNFLFCSIVPREQTYTILDLHHTYTLSGRNFSRNTRLHSGFGTSSFSSISRLPVSIENQPSRCPTCIWNTPATFGSCLSTPGVRYKALGTAHSATSVGIPLRNSTSTPRKIPLSAMGAVEFSL